MNDDKIVPFPIPRRVDTELLSDAMIDDYKVKMTTFFDHWEQSSDKDKQLMCKSLYESSLIYITAIKNLKKLTESMGGK